MQISIEGLNPQPTQKKVEMYTDGACSGNPGPGGFGTILRFGEREKEISGAHADTTNNRMEIMAVVVGFEALKRPCDVDVYSDSRYVIDCFEKGWVLRWQKNNWMRNKKESAKNVDLLVRLLDAMAGHNARFHWVAGHSGHTYNERCDKLAREAIKTLEDGDA